jgi:hypothetical protein
MLISWLSLVFEFWPVSSIPAIMYHSSTDNKVIRSGSSISESRKEGILEVLQHVKDEVRTDLVLWAV